MVLTERKPSEILPHFSSEGLPGFEDSYYFNARWYDSELGRFISQDPIQDGLNWYVYCNNNPLKYVDPTGLYDTQGTSLDDEDEHVAATAQHESESASSGSNDSGHHGTDYDENSTYYSASDFGASSITQGVNQDSHDEFAEIGWYTIGHPACDLTGEGYFIYPETLVIFKVDQGSKLKNRALFIVVGTDDLLYLSHADPDDIKNLLIVLESDASDKTIPAGTPVIPFPTTTTEGDNASGPCLHIERYRMQGDGSYEFVNPQTNEQLPDFDYQYSYDGVKYIDWKPKYPGYQSWWGWE